MADTMMLGEFNIEIIWKNIKNLHLSVYPPSGAVRIAAPLSMKIDTIRLFAISKLNWIKRQQKKLMTQDRESIRLYVDGESHYVWGKRYLLKLAEDNRMDGVQLKHNKICLFLRANSSYETKQSIMDRWYREQLKMALPPLIDKWQLLIGVKVQRFFIQKMKTKWGSCNTGTASLRFNSELAKKNRTCLEYIVVHEMIHLLEPSHNQRFVALMDKFMPNWHFQRDLLNKSPLAYAHWKY